MLVTLLSICSRIYSFPLRLRFDTLKPPPPPSTILLSLVDCLYSHSNKDPTSFHSSHFPQQCPYCPFAETPLHLLWECHWSQCVWHKLQPPNPYDSFSTSNIFDWCCTNATCNYLVVDKPWNLIYIFLASDEYGYLAIN